MDKKACDSQVACGAGGVSTCVSPSRHRHPRKVRLRQLPAPSENVCQRRDPTQTAQRACPAAGRAVGLWSPQQRAARVVGPDAGRRGVGQRGPRRRFQRRGPGDRRQAGAEGRPAQRTGLRGRSGHPRVLAGSGRLDRRLCAERSRFGRGRERGVGQTLHRSVPAQVGRRRRLVRSASRRQQAVRRAGNLQRKRAGVHRRRRPIRRNDRPIAHLFGRPHSSRRSTRWCSRSTPAATC